MAEVRNDFERLPRRRGSAQRLNPSWWRGGLVGGGSPDSDANVGPTLFESVWRHRWLIALVTIVMTGAVFQLSSLQEPLYETQGRMILGDPNAVGFGQVRGYVDPLRHAQREAERMRSTEVMVRASDLMGGIRTAETISKRASITPGSELEILTIAVTDPDADVAAQMANAIAEAYKQSIADRISEDTEEAVRELEIAQSRLQERIDELQRALESAPGDLSLQAQVEAATQELLEVETRASQYAVDAALFGSGVELYEPAAVPADPASPKPLSDAAVGGVLSFAAATGFAWWNAGRRRRADSREDPATVLGAPLLGAIPQARWWREEPPGATWTLSGLGPQVAEAYQFVVASLEFALEDLGARTVLITSAAPGEGKTITALSLATAASREDASVLLVDADTRARALSRQALADKRPGLTELAYDGVSLDDCSTPMAAQVSPVGRERRVKLVPAGRLVEDTAGFFRTTAFRKAMVKIREHPGMILIDSPPMLAVADTLAMVGQVDGAVVVVRRGTSMAGLAELRRRLDMVGTPLIGYIYNRDIARGRDVYGYGYEGDPPADRLSRR